MVMQICVDMTVKFTVQTLLFPPGSLDKKNQKQIVQWKKKTKLGSSKSTCYWAVQIKAHLQEKIWKRKHEEKKRLWEQKQGKVLLVSSSTHIFWYVMNELVL